MAIPIDSSHSPMFPVLTDAQIARFDAVGIRRKAAAGELIFTEDIRRGLYVVISGGIEIVNPSRDGDERITMVGPRQFTGEVNTLTGRRALVRGRAVEPTEMIEIDPASLRQIVQADAELSEILLRAFLLRRTELIARASGDLMLIGSSHSPDTLRLKEFLARNGHPFTYLDVDRDAEVRDLLGHFAIGQDEIPVLMCHGKPGLRNPSNSEVAACLGFNAAIDDQRVYDVIVVGAGPAGLASAVYAASEGLSVLVLESAAPGGQAGSSSRIENYLGFPTGVSGQELAGRAFVQAEKFGAQIAIARVAEELKCDQRPFSVETVGAGPVQAKAVIIATGAEYRKLPVPNLQRFEGAGVYYGATHLEAQLCGDQEVAIVGGGNSAGQAAVFLSSVAKHVHVLVRGPGLADSMSRYLIRRIEESPAITLRARTEVIALDGKDRLERISWEDKTSGQTETRGIRHLFSMAGACPNTAWLHRCVALDEKEFIKTGADLTAEELEVAKWPLRRRPYLFETSLPHVFAVGDVRSGSVKRVASAVGEGSVVVQLVHRILTE